MKNPLEKLFSGAKKKTKDAMLATAFTASVFNTSAAENSTRPVLDEEIPTTENVLSVTDSRDSEATASYEAEQLRLAQIADLEQKIDLHNDTLAQLRSYLLEVQNDFKTNYLDGLHFKEGQKAKSKLEGFENRLADLAMNMGREKVATYDITSPKAVNGLLGILLSGDKDAPLGKEAAYLAGFIQGQLGPTTAIGGVPGTLGYQSPDMAIHKHLGSDPRFIVETSLKMVKQEYEIEKAEAELRRIKAVPDELSAAVNESR
jgi:hypothetical protein